MRDVPLLELIPATYNLTTEAIPYPLALREGLVWIVIYRTTGTESTRYQLPVQWTPQEAGVLLNEIRGLSWHLDEDGIPVDYLEIVKLFAEFCRQQ